MVPSSRIPPTADIDIDSGRRLRDAGSPLARVALVGGAALALLHIYFNTFGTWSELRVNVVHFGGFGALCALLYPAFQARTRAGARVAAALDVGLAVAALACVGYLMLGEEAFFARNARFLWYDWVFTLLAPLLILEFVRRTTGLLPEPIEINQPRPIA